MGQYYKIVNLDKKQYLHPHDFGDGLKLCEFGSSGMGTMFALAALLSNGNGRGGGDISSNDSLIGSWAGDRIVVIGDYADPGQFGIDSDVNLYNYSSDNFENISTKIKQVLIKAGESMGPSFSERFNFADS